MQERVDAATARYHELGDSIKASEKRLAEIAVLKAHIINYAKTRPVYDAYRKTGYSKRFLETHRTKITLHKAAKAAFDEANLKTLPKVKELDAEYSKRLTEKKARYPDYRKAKEEMQEFLRAKKNIELFFDEEKSQSKPNIPDKQYDPENFAAYPAGFSGPFLLIAQSVLRTAFPVLSSCLAIMLSSSCVIVAQFATR